MIAYVNTELMAICHPDDEEHSILVAEYLTQLILSQSGYMASGAYFSPEN